MFMYLYEALNAAGDPCWLPTLLCRPTEAKEEREDG